ncbi:DNA methyltransferase [Rhizobium ruizarguesonis]
MSTSATRQVSPKRDGQLTFGLERASVVRFPSPSKVARAIEADEFPFEYLSNLAEKESWRKEVNRPLSHIHKWWAQRLGSVFRATVLGALAPKGTDILAHFYSATRFPDAVVFDPFMGSGTTVIEALKLGAKAIGRDINPVAHFLVKNAVSQHKRSEVIETFKTIERDTAPKLRSLYAARLPDGTEATTLYYFWVKQVDCPSCQEPVDLFSSRIFARHAYARKFPECQATCPACGTVNEVRYDATRANCTACHQDFNPAVGPASGQTACCPSCDQKFSIAKTVRASGNVPKHRLYAKLVLLPNGEKQYLPADAFDLQLFEDAKTALAKLNNPYPVAHIEPGYNTNQALNYNYRQWHQFFNERQLLALSILGDRIREIQKPEIRELFLCLFSGALEFNNMFASYKGEGTGAVRHMFSHHILKPERTPLEANLWGTTKSSGAFSTLFVSRILRALDYADDPFELRIDEGTKADKCFGLSEPIGYANASDFEDFEEDKRVYASCGNSGATDLKDKSVDAIVTDPPFFDNVNYSQLADFFHVWQRHVLDPNGCEPHATTRMEDEVQHGDVDVFQDRLSMVWSECHRVLKDEGLMVFSYHHSRTEGWRSVLGALITAGFDVVASQPVKAEMSVAMPKLQAKEPIDLDILLVCRKRNPSDITVDSSRIMVDASGAAERQIKRFVATRRKLSRNDVRIILMGQLLRHLSVGKSMLEAAELLESFERDIEPQIDHLHKMQFEGKTE